MLKNDYQRHQIETAPINLKSDIESCVKYFKLHGEKTRKKPIINAEAPGNVKPIQIL